MSDNRENHKDILETHGGVILWGGKDNENKTKLLEITISVGEGTLCVMDGFYVPSVSETGEELTAVGAITLSGVEIDVDGLTKG